MSPELRDLCALGIVILAVVVGTGFLALLFRFLRGRAG